MALNNSFEVEKRLSHSSSEEEKTFISQSLNLAGPEEEDISIEWVNQCEDLKTIANPISLAMLTDAIKNRDLEMEFRILIRITETNFHTKKIVDYCPHSTKLNRYSSVLPCRFGLTPDNFNRVILEKDSTIDFDANQYINASMIKVDFLNCRATLSLKNSE